MNLNKKIRKEAFLLGIISLLLLCSTSFLYVTPYKIELNKNNEKETLKQPFISNRDRDTIKSNSQLFGWMINLVDGYQDCYVPSLAFDGSGNPAISYCDENNLKYAQWNGIKWIITDIDIIGRYPHPQYLNSLCFDIIGNPGIVYYDYNGYLKYAYWDGNEWKITLIDYVGYNIRQVMDISLIFDSSGNPHIAYYNGEENFYLKYAYFDSIDWNYELIYSDGLNHEETRSTCLALDKFDNPYISFRYMRYDLSASDWGIGLAKWEGDSWSIELIDIGIYTGRSHSLSLDSLGNPAVAYNYFPGEPINLKYASFDGSNWKFKAFTEYGRFPFLAFDLNDNPAISYISDVSLKFTYFDGIDWNNEIIDDDAAFQSLAFDKSGKPAISYTKESSSDLMYTVKSINLPPIVEFTFAPDKPIIGEKVRFNATDSYDPDGGAIVNYLWDFGDGNLEYSSTPYINHSYINEGPQEVKLRVWDYEGYISEITKLVTIVTDWSYAIITDLHIGRGYPEYNGEDYYLTERLEKTKDEILSVKDENNIKFVAVLGDLSENGKPREVQKAKDILDVLNDPNGDGNTDDGIAYFPLIGNHDVHTPQEGDMGSWVNYNNIFNLEFFELQFEILGIEWDSSKYWDSSKFLNFAFRIGNLNFICLDLVKDDVLGEIHPQTMAFLSNCLMEDKKAILFSHIPLVPLLVPIGEFSEIQGWYNVESCFAGHVHGFYDIYGKFRRHLWNPVEIENPMELQDWIFGNPIFFNANFEYKYITPGNVAVITTEALMVGSNEGEPKGIIRIVDIKSTMIQGEIVDYNEIIGVFSAINPHLKVLPFVYPEGNYFQVNFEIFPFTGSTLWGPINGFLFLDRRFETLSYHINFGDGDSDFILDWNPLMPKTINHYYYLDPQMGSKTYNIELKMIGITLEGEVVTETIEKKLNLQHKDPEFYIMANSPVDLMVIDPDGLQICKEVNEIDRALYDEFDIDGDGELEDIILFLEPKEGEYLISVVPEQGALPTDIYALEASADGIVSILANDVQIKNIPDKPYIIESTEQEIKPIIPATINFDPDTLNLNSTGNWITVYIELPIGHGYDISNIDLSSILLNDLIEAKLKPNELGDYDLDGIPDLMVKFDLLDVQEILQVGEEVPIIITGKLEDERTFRGEDIIRVISHEEIVLENEESYSQPISYLLLISVNPLTLQLVALVGIVTILVIMPKKKYLLTNTGEEVLSNSKY